MIRPQKVGHVVLKVRDLQRSERFFTEVLGFEVVTRLKNPRGVFFTLASSIMTWRCWKCPLIAPKRETSK